MNSNSELDFEKFDPELVTLVDSVFAEFDMATAAKDFIVKMEELEKSGPLTDLDYIRRSREIRLRQRQAQNRIYQEMGLFGGPPAKEQREEVKKKSLPTPEEFEALFTRGEINIILLGMSGAGKSEWQKRIAGRPDNQFTPIEIDSRIGNNPQMTSFFDGIEGKDEAEKMGKKFGAPWDNPYSYRLHEDRYLQAEREEMQRAAEEMENEDGPHIIDLTGSAIYCPRELNNVLTHGLSVYLGVGKEQYKKMLANYLAEAKPVCWGQVMSYWFDAVRHEGGMAHENIAEFYAILLRTRSELYQQFADITLTWDDHRSKADIDNPDTFFEVIKSKL